MPVTLPDDLALLLFKTLTKVPPVSGQVIIDMLTSQSQMLAEQQKLLQQLQGQVNIMSTTESQFQSELTSFGDDLKKQTTVANGLKVAFAGIAQKLADATTAAQTAGASPEELAALKALHADLLANTTTMSDSITTGTVAQGETPAPVVPTVVVDPALVTSGAADGTATGTAEGTATGTAA